jgi:1-acyl-sn-glycerol-3-phosphate acyltransferase
LRVVIAVVFAFLGPIRIRGRRNFPRRGGVLIIANHLSNVDPVVTQYACPRLVYFLAKSILFEVPVVKTALGFWRAVSINQGQPDPAAFRQLIALLRAGYPVCVYPEGGLSDTGELKDIHRGIALIIRATGVPVICLALRNTDKVLPYRARMPRFSGRFVWATWDKPHVFAPGASNEEVTRWVSEQLRDLLDEDK